MKDFIVDLLNYLCKHIYTIIYDWTRTLGSPGGGSSGRSEDLFDTYKINNENH